MKIDWEKVNNHDWDYIEGIIKEIYPKRYHEEAVTCFDGMYFGPMDDDSREWAKRMFIKDSKEYLHILELAEEALKDNYECEYCGCEKFEKYEDYGYGIFSVCGNPDCRGYRFDNKYEMEIKYQDIQFDVRFQGDCLVVEVDNQLINEMVFPNEFSSPDISFMKMVQEWEDRWLEIDYDLAKESR